MHNRNLLLEILNYNYYDEHKNFDYYDEHKNFDYYENTLNNTEKWRTVYLYPIDASYRPVLPKPASLRSFFFETAFSNSASDS